MNLFGGIEHIERVFISAIVIVAGVVIIYFATRWLSKYLKVLKEKSVRKKIVRRAVIPSLLFVALISLKLNLPLVISDDGLLANASHFITILLIVTGTWVTINITAITRIIILSNYDVQQKNNLHARKMHTQLRIIERVIVFTIIFFAIASILMTFDSIRRIGISLFASAGVAGLILGLAAQKVIGSICWQEFSWQLPSP
jgi:small-conductance mechanosensitive channel